MAVLEALASKYGFTETEEAVADYVLAHADEVAGMNIGDLSAATYCSNATIVRLCRKLGVEGYRDFRIALAAELERSRSGETDINPDTPFLEGQGTRTIVSSIANLSKLAIDNSYASVQVAEVRKASKMILGARRVALYAIGDSEISAEGFVNLLLKTGITCYVANQHGDALAVSAALGPADVAVIVSYSGALLGQFAEEIALMRMRGCKTVVLSSDASIPSKMAGLECFVKLPEGESRSNKIATFYAQECIRFALNCIYGECFSQNYQRNLEHIENYDQHRTEPYRE